MIDLKDFLGALESIGYDDPAVCEPFKKELADLPGDAARLKAVGEATGRMLESARR